jgi:hypothetical protein
MPSLIVTIDFLLTPIVLRAIVCATVISLALCWDCTKRHAGQSRWQRCKQAAQNYALPIATTAFLGWLWLILVNLFVPKPYMVGGVQAPGIAKL